MIVILSDIDGTNATAKQVYKTYTTYNNTVLQIDLLALTNKMIYTLVL